MEGKKITQKKVAFLFRLGSRRAANEEEEKKVSRESLGGRGW